MTRYTPRQRFPYPASKAEYGNAAAQLEALAVQADAALDRVSAQWAAFRSPGHVLYKLTSNFNIPVANGLTGFSPPFPPFTAVSLSAGYSSNGFPFGINTPTPAQYGWWDIAIHVAAQASGTADAGTRRYMQAQKTNASNAVDADTNIYVWEDEESSAGGVNGAELNFFMNVTSTTRGVVLAYLHANTSSSVNLLSQGTFLEAIQITGAIT